MTYFGFLLRFLVTPILLLLFITWREKDQPTPNFVKRMIWTSILVHVFLAVVYTTPWDNYLVATGVWYYNPELVTGIVFGYVPLEEYTFFVLETIMAGLWWWFLARRLTLPKREDFKPSASFRWTVFVILFVIWVVFTYLFFFSAEGWNYLSIIFFWALPAIFPQILFGADILWHHRKLVFLTIFIPGVYLSLMDIVALSDTTWSISQSETTGMLFFGILPLEEVVFFFITNVLIGFGMTLMLSEIGQARLKEWRKRFFETVADRGVKEAREPSSG